MNDMRIGREEFSGVLVSCCFYFTCRWLCIFLILGNLGVRTTI